MKHQTQLSVTNLARHSPRGRGTTATPQEPMKWVYTSKPPFCDSLIGSVGDYFTKVAPPAFGRRGYWFILILIVTKLLHDLRENQPFETN